MGIHQGGDGYACFHETVDDMIDGALNSGHAWMKGITRQRLEAEPQVRLNFTGNGDADAKSEPYLPFACGNFMTASGKAELYSAQLESQGLDPVASFIAPRESRHSERARQFPLELLGRKADNHLNSTFCNLPSHQKMEEPQLLEMSPADANARGIRDGDAVRVFNSRGELTLQARVDGAVRTGVVAAKLDWARFNPEGKNINVLTSETLTEIGAGATFYSCLVEVSRVGGAQA
jgi:anaerobic selenocysteine-containing dehydrogenase